MKGKSSTKANRVYDESYYSSLIDKHKNNLLKKHREGLRLASDDNFFDQYFISNTLDSRKRKIEQTPILHPFFQIVTTRLALTKLTKFEVLNEYCNENNLDVPITAELLAEYEAILSVWTDVTNKNYYAINTGTVYSNLYEMWNEETLHSITRDELHKIGIEIEHLLRSKNVESYINWESDPWGLKDYIDNRYKHEIELTNDESNFPFPRYFILQKKSPVVDLQSDTLIPKQKRIATKYLPQYFTVIFFDQPQTVSKTDAKFPFFFALQLYTLDVITEVEHFLIYHLSATFDKDIKGYKYFLESLSRKYKFLKDLHEPAIQHYLSSLSEEVPEREALLEIPEQDNKEYTLRRRVLAMTYLLSEFGIASDVDKTNIARFIQFFSGKDSTPKMDNNNIYKIVKRPFPSDDKALIRDLQFIRPFFEHLQLFSIVDKINKEIATRDKNPG